MDTQSAGLFKLTYALHHAYPCVKGSWERQIRAWHTHRRTHNTRNTQRRSALFYIHNARSQLRAGEPRGATKAAGRARAGRLSRPKIATALLRHLSRPARRLAAPGRLAATRGSSGSAAGEASRRRKIACGGGEGGGDLAADGGGAGGEADGAAQQRVERIAAVRGLQVHASGSARRHSSGQN